MSSKLEPVIWSRDTGHIIIHGVVDVRSLQYFLNYGALRAEFHYKLVFCPPFLFSQLVSMSLCVDSRELESSHVSITFSELVAFPPAVYAKPKAKNYIMKSYIYVIDQHNEVCKGRIL